MLVSGVTPDTRVHGSDVLVGETECKWKEHIGDIGKLTQSKGIESDRMGIPL